MVRMCCTDVRGFGCGVTSCHARRCCRNRCGLLRKQIACGKCDALQTTDNRPQGDAELAPISVCTVVVSVGNDKRNESDESWNTRKSVSLVSDRANSIVAFPVFSVVSGF